MSTNNADQCDCVSQNHCTHQLDGDHKETESFDCGNNQQLKPKNNTTRQNFLLMVIYLCCVMLELAQFQSMYASCGGKMVSGELWFSFVDLESRWDCSGGILKGWDAFDEWISIFIVQKYIILDENQEYWKFGPEFSRQPTMDEVTAWVTL
eukprot:197783_1